MTTAMFALGSADFGQPQAALHSVADPVRSTGWQIFFTVLRAQPLSRYAAIICHEKAAVKLYWRSDSG